MNKLWRIVTSLVIGLLVFAIPAQPVMAMSGSGTAESPYIITTVTDLQNVNNDLTAYYELGNDIDATGVFYSIGTDITGYLAEFTGSFDGNGYTITDLTQSSDYGTGLFYSATDATIKNIVLEDCVIEALDGADLAGLISYANDECVIDNITIINAVLSADTDSDWVGLLAAFIDGGGTVAGCIVTNCMVEGTITITAGTNRLSNYTEYGGFVSESGNVYFTDCFVDITLTAINAVAGNTKKCFWAGGFVGLPTYCFFTRCAAIGSLVITDVYDEQDSYIGGFSSLDDSVSCTDCYSRVDLTLTSTSAAAGQSLVGFGYNWWGSVLTNCYYAGVITNNTLGGHVDGFANNDSFGGAVTSCYWDTVVSGTAHSDDGTGKTTAQMKTQSTYIGWDFD